MMGHRGSAEEEAVGDGEDGAEVDEAPDEDDGVGEVRVGVGDAVFASFFSFLVFWRLSYAALPEIPRRSH